MLVLGPVSEGGCGVNHIGGTHELLHILGLAHVQNRPDRWDQIVHDMTCAVYCSRCNYIDVRTDLLTGWGEWKVGQITGAADWFELRCFAQSISLCCTCTLLLAGFLMIALPTSTTTSCRVLSGRRALKSRKVGSVETF